MSLDGATLPVIVSAAWGHAMDGREVHFQSQNHPDKKHLKMKADDTIVCDGGKGKPATWVIRKGKGNSIKLENGNQAGKFLKVNAKGEYTQGPGGGEPCMFHLVFEDFDAATCRLVNVKFPAGHIGVKKDGTMKPYNDTGAGPASLFQVSGNIFSPKWFQIIPRCNEAMQLNVFGAGGAGADVKCWDDKTNDNAKFCLTPVNKKQHRISPKHKPDHSMNIWGGTGKGNNVKINTDLNDNSVFHATEYDGTYFRLEAKGSNLTMNVRGGNGEQGAEIMMYDDKNANSMFRIAF